MDNKVELGLKALWLNMDNVFKEIGQRHTEIRGVKQKMLEGGISLTLDKKVDLGKRVKAALEKKRQNEAEEILDALTPTAIKIRANKVMGDDMLLNCAFLVDKTREREFDDIINDLGQKYRDRLKFKYVGPIAPFNFAELVIRWGQEENE